MVTVPTRQMNQKIAVAVVFVAAMFMNIMDVTIVNVALPTIGREFGVRADAVDTVVIAYLVSLAVFIPASGWLGDRFGPRRVLLTSVVIFTGASALCGAAGSLGQLVFFRVLQGAGGGLMVPVGMAMLFRAFPPAERVRASSIMVIPTAMAPALGPVIGGLFVTDLSWRWVFYVNVPIGIAAVTFGLVFLAPQTAPQPGRFDLPRLRAGRRGSGPAHVRDLGGSLPRLGFSADRWVHHHRSGAAGAAGLGGAAHLPPDDRCAALLRPAVRQHQRGAGAGVGGVHRDAVPRGLVLPGRPRSVGPPVRSQHLSRGDRRDGRRPGRDPAALPDLWAPPDHGGRPGGPGRSHEHVGPLRRRVQPLVDPSQHVRHRIRHVPLLRALAGSRLRHHLARGHRAGLHHVQRFAPAGVRLRGGAAQYRRGHDRARENRRRPPGCEPDGLPRRFPRRGWRIAAGRSVRPDRQ